MTVPDYESVRPTISTEEAELFAKQRREMVDETVIGRNIVDEAVIEALAAVPRHQVVAVNVFATIQYP